MACGCGAPQPGSPAASEPTLKDQHPAAPSPPVVTEAPTEPPEGPAVPGPLAVLVMEAPAVPPSEAGGAGSAEEDATFAWLFASTSMPAE